MTAPPLLVGVAVDTRMTGITVRDHTRLTAHALIPYQDSDTRWLRQVLDQVQNLTSGRERAIVLTAWPGVRANTNHYPPHTHGELLNALLTGWVLAHGWELRQVRPAIYGGWLRDGYPSVLYGPRERRPFSHGRLRLCRIAWGMTGAALPHGNPTSDHDRAELLDRITVTVDRDPYRGWDHWREENAALLTAACPFHAPPDSYCRIPQRNVPHDQDLPGAPAFKRYKAEVIAPHVDKHLHDYGRVGNQVTATYRGWPA